MSLPTAAPRTRGGPDLRIHDRLWIGGEFVDAADGATYETIDPHDGSVIARVARAGPADVDRAVAAAAAAQPAWGAMQAAARGRVLLRLADLIEANADELARLESLDTGHPVRDSRALDVVRAATTFRYFGGMADKSQGDVIPVEPGFLNYVLRGPIGVVGQIVPWNFPLMFTSWKMGPALAAGNSIVLQARGADPALIAADRGAAGEAGLPPGVVNLLPGPGRVVGEHIAAHPGLGKVSFTGSTAIGPPHRGALGRQPQARAARARRQGREHRVRRRRPRRGRERLCVRDLPQPGPGLHRGLAAHAPRVHRGGVHGALRGARRSRSGWATRSTPRPRWGR